jgi:hypothetical protein
MRVQERARREPYNLLRAAAGNATITMSIGEGRGELSRRQRFISLSPCAAQIDVMARLGVGTALRAARAAIWLCVVLGCLSAPAAAQREAAHADSTGGIVGIVAMKDGGLPLSYSVVSVPALGRERFSNDQGVFTLADLPAGPVLLRVRHLGYSPAELSVIVHAGRVDTIHVQLVHIAVRLSTVQVRGYPECKDPGVPKAADDSAFATVFDQLHQNADQYRLLTRTYPYLYQVERTLSTTLVNGDVKVDGIDTVGFESASAWTYKPGTVITRSGSRFFGGTLMMNIPTLVHFADRVFIENHCFYNGGLETVDGVDMLRVDFVAATKIRDPDVNGSMYLDPSSFRIRRSVVRLSRIPNGVAGLRETEAVTYFGEIMSSIPIIAGISSVNRFDANARRPQSAATANEQQRLIVVQFLKGRPGDEPKKP